MNNKFYSLLLIFFFTTLPVSLSAQRNKGQTTWLSQKKSYESRLRYGGGLHLGATTGIHWQFYKLSDICTSGITMQKKLTLDISLSQEGILFSDRFLAENSLWKKGGLRFGLDLKYHAPILLNPYVGLGFEAGTRNFSSSKDNHSDAVLRLGLEQKLFGTRLSRSSSMLIKLFAEGKYNTILATDYNYLAANFGVRFHFF